MLRHRAAGAFHAFAWATLVVTFAFPLFVGALVTSYDVGMAVPDWPTTFLQSMFGYDFRNAPLGVMVEHSHRLFGALVGLMTLILGALAVWARAPRSTLWLAVAAIVGVIAQGVLGGLRVRLDAQAGREIAAVHGVCAELFVAVLVALIYFAGRSPSREPVESEHAGLMRNLSRVLVGMLICQIAFGAGIRHLGLGVYAHVGFAAGILALGGAVLMINLLDREIGRALYPIPIFFVGLLCVQVMLGVGAAVLTGLMPPGFGPQPKFTEVLVTALHKVAGSTLWATGLFLALRTHTLLRPAPAPRSENATLPALEAAG